MRPVNALARHIFRRNFGSYFMYYAPGLLCVVDPDKSDKFESFLVPPGVRAPLCGKILSSGDKDLNDVAAKLWNCADLAVAQAAGLQGRPFRPESLTLFMNYECNLRCIYCHTDSRGVRGARLDTDATAAAAEMVAVNCRSTGLPLLAVFHGGGEPTLHRERVDIMMGQLQSVASNHGIELKTYVATNGIMPEEKTAWLAKRFDLIGLSCDGPDDVQNRQRVKVSGRPTSHILRRTARILREKGARLHVRTTITDETLHRQAEIAEYLCNEFTPEEIHFEPVYIGGRRETPLNGMQVDDFVSNFLEGKRIARRHGVLLMTSGSRPNSVHGPYCNIFRSVLNLVPEGFATACFKVSAGHSNKDIKIGEIKNGKFVLDQGIILEIDRRLSVYPSYCSDCFNRFHCTRECPDICPLEEKETHISRPGFRCKVQQTIIYRLLGEIAEQLWQDRKTCVSSYRIRNVL